MFKRFLYSSKVPTRPEEYFWHVDKEVQQGKLVHVVLRCHQRTAINDDMHQRHGHLAEVCDLKSR
jgi:hypothetical protein